LTIYYSILNALLLIAAFILVKHSWHRYRYFLQMIQQNGYKIREYFQWLLQHFYTKVIMPEHFLIVLIIFSLLFFISEQLTITASTLILGLFVIFWFHSIDRFKPDQDKKPLVYTPRMQRLAFIQGLILLFFIYVIGDLSFTGRLMNTPIVIRDVTSALLIAEPYFLLFGLILIDMSIPFFLILASMITMPVEWNIHRGFKKKARQKLEGLSNLTVIGITGSYGKTSTKFMIHALLRERYQVCVTPGSYNTPMGICKVINNDLESHHQVLILEMGARYEGNIKELCEIARPDISVITNTGKAHLETFGSPEAIVREKSTLVQEVKQRGVLVLNADDEDVLSMAKLRPDAKVISAGLNNGDLQASEISYDNNGTTFKMHWREGENTKEFDIEMKLLGAHNVLNFLLAAAVARNMGLRPATIAHAATRIEPVEHRLELKTHNGLIVIDDAFNSNPVGAKNALEILKAFTSGRRIIITPGMIELGELQYEENKKFGRQIAEAGLDLIILVGKEQTAPILEGIREISPDTNNIRVVHSLFEANKIVKEYGREGDVVLYENDLPDTYSE